MLSWRLPSDPMAGGAETLTFEILKRAVKADHEVTWFAARPDGQSDEEWIDGMRFVRRGRQWTVHLFAWIWLRRRKRDFDVVVDQVNTLPFFTPFYLPADQRRMFIHQTAREYWWHQPRGLFRIIAPIGYLAEPVYLRVYKTTRTITVSESTRSELVALGIPKHLIGVIPEAITTVPLSALPAKTGSLRVIVIGRITPAKFIDEAIEAFRFINREIPASVLDVVGTGNPAYLRRLQELVSRCDLSDAVTFHGRVSEQKKGDLLQQAHLHLFASHREGWGLTVTEAAAMGTPTIGYDAPGVRDSVRDPRALAPLGEGPAGLARRALAICEDSALYNEIRNAAWSFARTLSHDVTAERFLDEIV